jgi:hypothetical protein
VSFLAATVETSRLRIGAAVEITLSEMLKPVWIDREDGHVSAIRQQGHRLSFPV